MFVRVQAAVGVAGDTDRMRPVTRDALNSLDTLRKMVAAALSSPTRFPKTRLVNSTSLEDDSASVNISIHDGTYEAEGCNDKAGDAINSDQLEG